MTTMSDDGDRTCPLCAEEMDFTDQNLKPCKCGYEICVWCWHHITEMAEKDGLEGRCPACRMVYDKQKIVGMADKRMVAEIGIEKKPKSQKTKNKSSTTEDRKHLSSVRVVQKNLVYIMGMPSNLADENILERKEYFGQYGKILKVSVSRQAGPTTQQASNNNTFSVYITYAREEEAIRCIQAAHNFVLEGKPLRAYFGTTKYCYAWLRNMTCTNPDCLYLHDIGSQEDSFTKDEIISAYTRSRVPQFPSNNLQPRAGNVLPPVDELHNNGAVSTKNSTKVSYNNTTNQAKSTPIDISVPRSTVLPAAASWGLRSSNSRSPASSIASTQNHPKQKIEVLSSSSSSTIVSSTKQNSAWHDDTVTNSKIPEGSPMIHADGGSGCFEPLKLGNVRDPFTKLSDSSSRLPLDMDHSSGSAWDDDFTTSKMPDGNHTVHPNGRSRNTETSKSADTTSIADTPAESILDEAHHSAWDDDTVSTSNMQGERKIGHNDDRFRSLGTLETGFGYSRAFASDVTLNTFPSEVQSFEASNKCSLDELSLQHENGGINASRVNTDPMNNTYSEGDICELSISCTDDITNMSAAVNENTERLCVGLSSVNLDARLGIDCINVGQQQSSATEHCLNNNFEDVNSRIQQYYPENEAEGLAFTPGNSASAIPNAHISGKLFDWRSGLWNQASSSSGNGIEEALATSDDPRLMVSAAPNSSSSSSYKNYSLNISNHLANSFQNGEVGDKRFSIDGGSRILGTELDRGNGSLLLNGHNGETQRHFVKNGRILEYPNTSYTEELYSGGFDDISNIKKAANIDKEEESIESKIVSADFDPWDNSWSSANNFAKLLAQANKQEGPPKQSSTWMSQNNSQSRFSFARQENQASLGESSYRDAGLAHLVSSKQELYGNSIGITSPISNFEHAKVLGHRSSTISSDSTAGIMRTKISAPPGFSVPNRAPPPGFSSQDRFDQTFSTFSDTQLLGSPLQNQFQVHSTSNAGDVEFIDPAILAVGKGRLPIGVNNTGMGGRLPLGVNNTGLGSRFAYHPQFSSAESEARIQLLMQQSMSANQDPRILNHVGDRFSQLDDAYTASRFSAQNPSLSPYTQISHQQSSHQQSPYTQISHQQSSPILNSQWNSWNDMQNGNGMGIPDILMSERFGLNNYIPVSEEPKFHLQNSGEFYNRAFGM